MRLMILGLIPACLLLAGCGDGADSTSNSGTDGIDGADGSGGVSTGGQAAGIQSGTVSLTPENTTIQFVGTHVTESGPDPNARTGVFTEFMGSAEVDIDSKLLETVSVEIQTDSLVTAQGGLNTHLKSADFFDTREYPMAKFESTSITPTADGVTIVGNLTLLAETREVSFPATVAVGEEELSLEGTFVLDRTEFGMDRLQERVNKEVAITVMVGKRTEAPEVAAGPGGRGGRFDPAEFFARQDADGDGKLTGDEIPDRMRQDIASIDSDEDGSVTLEEFRQGMGRRGGRRGGGEPQNEDAASDPPSTDEGEG